MKAWPGGMIADGATGNMPSGCSDGCEIRPTCQSCRKMRPPAAWTASVTSRQPSTCSRLWMPGVQAYPWPCIETCVASEMISAAEARWA